MTHVKFLRGDPDDYRNLKQRDPDTLYFLYESDESAGELWLGDRLLARATKPEDIVEYLSQLKDVDISGALNNMYLGFDAV